MSQNPPAHHPMASTLPKTASSHRPTPLVEKRSYPLVLNLDTLEMFHGTELVRAHTTGTTNRTNRACGGGLGQS